MGAVQKLTVQVQKSTTKIAYCFLKMADGGKDSGFTSHRRMAYNRMVKQREMIDGGTRMFDLKKAGFTTTNGMVSSKADCVVLHGEGTVFGQKFYGEQKSYTYAVQTPFSMEEYFVLEYAAQGLRRQLSFRKPFVFALTADGGEVPLVCYDDVVLDNRRHSVIVQTEGSSYVGIKIVFYIDRRFYADFSVYAMYTCASDELPRCCDKLLTDKAEAFTQISLEEQFNSRFCAEAIMIDGGRFFTETNVVLHHIPFTVQPEGNNLIAPPPAPKENDEEILNFGVKTKRGLCRPVSRDSLIEVPIRCAASEIFFIMSLRGKRHQRWGFASDGTILGEYCGDVTMPLLVDDVEGFMVTVVYQDGRRDTALPLNLSAGRHGVSGDVGVYAVPADGSRVERVIFHNRLLETDCCLAAVTVNQTQKRLLPEMLIPELAEPIVHSVETKQNISLQDDELFIQNGALSMRFGLQGGMKLLEMQNGYVKHSTVRPDYFIKLRDSEGTLHTDLTLVDAKAEGDSARVVYRYQGLELYITASFDGACDIEWNLRIHNVGDENCRMGILFPTVSGMQHKTAEDGWYFFPKYQNLNSNETVFIYEESAPSFPMQFLDVYSPAEQGGLALTTRERELVVRKYALEKDAAGIGFYVEYPAMYGEIVPNGDFTASPAVLTAHEGDWRASFAIYKKWLDSWYEPYKCQNKDWYRKCFWLLAEITDFVETKAFYKEPIWYDTETKEFAFKKVLEEQKEIAGCYPDILHLWSWTYRDENGKIVYKWGNYGESDYDEFGGLEAFSKALHEIRDDMGIPVSLYMHPTLLSASYPQAKHFFEKGLRVQNDLGNYIQIADAYRMCHANREWREEILKIYQRVYRELQIPLLYVDEFSLRIENRCYGKDHGHEVPSNLLKTDRNFISDLKDAMPEEVVLYGEYAAVDVNARYIDCNISYYIIDSVVDMIETAWRGGDGDDRLGRVFTDVYRFAFPKIVQLILPMAMRHLSWHPQKFIFFNGEAIYDSFWDNEESAGLDFTVKAYHLKKKYADCFASDTPETMVDTLSPAVCANRFPGDNREVYTLYNRAYSTYRGKALRVVHEEGTVYYDAWNETELTPVVHDGFAELSVAMPAQSIGCIEVRRRG